MPTREEIAYFGAGPAPLPTSVMQAGGKAFVNFSNTGLGLAEISHRSPTANTLFADCLNLLRTLSRYPQLPWSLASGLLANNPTFPSSLCEDYSTGITLHA